ncbi:hypothetical protein GCM10020219_044090 [Nonomuraea dietziae]
MLEHAATTDDRFGRLLLELREVFVRRGRRGPAQLQEQGLADRDLDPRLTAIMLGGMVEHFAHVWLDLGERGRRGHRRRPSHPSVGPRHRPDAGVNSASWRAEPRGKG